jgi:HPt (histidine-containing phosphotransfer) domain-containing protein
MSDKPLYSSLQNDPEMTELIEFFLGELDQRIAALTAAFNNADREELRAMAHQLKGAAAGYGYPTITDAARELEHSIDEHEADLSELAEQVEALVQLCRMASASRPA